jgi:thiol-disulfide isomerase/thioredoxin
MHYKSLKLTIALLTLLTTIITTSNQSVTSLSLPELDQKLASLQFAFVLFFDHKCVHCKGILPKLNTIHPIVSKSNIQIFKINCREFPAAIEEYGVSHFPAVVFFHKGKEVNTLPAEEAKSIEQIMRWIDTQLLPLNGPHFGPVSIPTDKRSNNTSTLQKPQSLPSPTTPQPTQVLSTQSLTQKAQPLSKLPPPPPKPTSPSPKSTTTTSPTPTPPSPPLPSQPNSPPKQNNTFTTSLFVQLP